MAYKHEVRKARVKFFLPQINETVSFPAYLSSLSDEFTSNWNSEQYYGVQDSIGNFVGTNRKINCSFKIIANDKFDSADYQIKLNKLAQSLYPEMSDEMVPTSSPLIGVKFHNIIQDKAGFLFGWIDGVSLTPDLAAAGYNFGDFEDSQVTFRAWDFSFGLNVIHKERPGRKRGGFTLGKANHFPVRLNDEALELSNARDKILKTSPEDLAKMSPEDRNRLYANAKLPAPNKPAQTQTPGPKKGK